MGTPHWLTGALVGLLSVIAAVHGGCAIWGVGGKPKHAADGPWIRRHPIPVTTHLRPDPVALPSGARAILPGFDGDSFFVSIPPKESADLTSRQVFDATIVTVLRAVGFTRNPRELGIPRDSGQALPSANLATLASRTCVEVSTDEHKRYQAVCDAMRTGRASPVAERVFQIGDGMSFAQFKADLERRRIEYFFPQLVDGVPIEHVGVVAARWEGETITLVHGNLLSRFVVTNKPVIDRREALARAMKGLMQLAGVVRTDARRSEPDKAEMLLLPYGRAQDVAGGDVPALRYTYRMLLYGAIEGPSRKPTDGASWLAWIDAQDGTLLQLLPRFAEASGSGATWRRDPGVATSPTAVRGFEVDAAAAGQYTLELNDTSPGVLNRIECASGSCNFQIPANAGGSTASFANFNQAPFNDPGSAVCGQNTAFHQINAFAHFSAYRDLISWAGAVPSFGTQAFPKRAVTIQLDQGLNYTQYDFSGTGSSLVLLAAGQCPGTGSAAHDTSLVAHEFAHLSTIRFQDGRDAAGPQPYGREIFHDFADAWASAYTSTPCIGGWHTGNQNCVAPTNELALPRLAWVPVPFSPSASSTLMGDHFPERRNSEPADQITPKVGYANGQLVAAALWRIRQGMRSKCLPSGTPQFWVRINRALQSFGFLQPIYSAFPPGITPATGYAVDGELYRYAQDFMLKMVEQWATSGQPGGPPGFRHNGAHTTNKVLSGWARVGFFLIPYSCLNGATPSQCPGGGQDGGAAVIDVDDNDQSDDVTIDDVTHPEVDYIKRGGGPPTFHVWTGPRYRFDATTGQAAFTPTTASPAPCHTQYQVELASDEAFTVNRVVSTPPGGSLRTVSSTVAPECYATWIPGAAAWNSLKGASGDTKVFYRVITRNASGGNQKVSTSVGTMSAGTWNVPPAYVIVNDLGRP